MVNNFKDIKIVELDENASHTREHNSRMVNIILILSESAPDAWARHFNNQWQQHFYMMKRDASVSGKRLEIYCLPEELQQYHIPELKSVISKTNLAYRSLVEQAQRDAAERNAAAARQRDELVDLKSKIKFD